MRPVKTPVIVVAGFLGSGKTTLLNHLLATARGTRVGVVVNDFGSIGIDAMSVAGQVGSTLSLSNGCLCCAVDVSGLDELLGKLVGQVDVIVIEASGLAEPQAMVRLVLGSEHPGVGYGGLVLLVDAAEPPADLARHLRVADLVVVNKVDRVPDASGLLAEVDRLKPGVPVVAATHGRVDPALLFDPRPRQRYGQLSFDDLAEDDEPHAHQAYESVSFTSAQPLNPTRLMAFLDDRPAGLYRIKGFAHFDVPGHRQKFTLHTVGAYLRFERSAWAADEPRLTQLVLIGVGLDAEAVTKALEHCVEPDPASVDPQSMLEVLRYL
ncbi:CobW family GTP-binding protein [Saccharothrix coeruleofusca]|uniref:CobW family GTP-binding protein n=1 Tax=Saccharothrix coeruleofusca TaxID=33919 RepID=UPI001E3ED801|nr:GTP-binding protein [Saccharothrix coeruleofusca]